MVSGSRCGQSTTVWALFMTIIRRGPLFFLLYTRPVFIQGFILEEPLFDAQRTVPSASITSRFTGRPWPYCFWAFPCRSCKHRMRKCIGQDRSGNIRSYDCFMLHEETGYIKTLIICKINSCLIFTAVKPYHVIIIHKFKQ